MADPTPEALRIVHDCVLDAHVEQLKASAAAKKSARGGMISLADALSFWGVAADATEADKLAAIKRTEEAVNSRSAPAVLAGLHMYLLDQFLCDVSQLAHAQRRCAAAKRHGRARVELPTPALAALLAEIERLRAIEAAARVLSQALRRGCTTDELYAAKGALREALGEDGAK